MAVAAQHDIAIARTSSEELRLHAYVDGKWHRRFLRRFMTACGIPFHSQGTALRQETLNGEELCGDCFTIAEQAENERIKNDSQKDVF